MISANRWTNSRHPAELDYSLKPQYGKTPKDVSPKPGQVPLNNQEVTDAPPVDWVDPSVTTEAVLSELFNGRDFGSSAIDRLFPKETALQAKHGDPYDSPSDEEDDRYNHQQMVDISIPRHTRSPSSRVAGQDD